MKLLTASLLLSAVSAINEPIAPQQQKSSQQQQAANANYVQKLVRNAVATPNSQISIHNENNNHRASNTLRRLDEQEAAYEVNIASYAVKFEQCQFVKSYDSELAQDENSATVLTTKRFVLFRLCPNATCSSCNSNFGEYLVDLESYLESTVEYFSAYQEEMCNTCEETCEQEEEDEADVDEEAAADGEDEAAEDGGRRRRLQQRQSNRLLGKNKFYNIQVNCTSCVEECDKIENMEANGYIDATEFLECAMIYDPEDDTKDALYAGPICASNGAKIKIGVFKDEDCMYLDASKEVDDYLVKDGVQAHLSHALLKSTYSDTCIACKEQQEQNENAEGDAQEDADEVIELCEQLYEDAAKCEKHYGFENGYGNYDGYENQLAQEEIVCEFMSSLKAGTYDEEGEIIVTGSSSRSRSGKATTGGQKFALTFFILGTVGLAVYAAMLHSKLVRGGKTNLSHSGGSMA